MRTTEAEYGERWRSVVGYEGQYEVSNLGRVRSLARIDARGHRLEGRMLKIVRHPRGYEQIRLTGHGGFCTAKVHHLVLEAFVGPRPDGMEGCHGNAQRDDNRVGNLRWDTPKENQADRRRDPESRPSTVCKRGHVIGEPNIVHSDGKRKCRACHLERGRSNATRRPFDSERANRGYAQIMGHLA